MKVNVNGIQLNYELSGNESGPVVVMSHSLGSNLKMWAPQVKALESEFSILRFDTRGHGLSDAPAGKYSLDMLAQDAIALFDVLNLKSVHWVGLSMGGMIGQTVAINHPKRLKSLTICDTGSVLPDDAQTKWQERIDQVRKDGMAAIVDGTLAGWFTPAFLEKNSDIAEETSQQLNATAVDGYVGCIWAIRGLNTIGRLQEIKIPTLIMVGSEDMRTPLLDSQLMHERISGSELVIIPDAAHLSSVAQPGFFNRTLLAFLHNQ